MVKKEDEISELLLDLCILASNFSILLAEHEREKAAGKYWETLEKLYATGWDEPLEMACRLPPEYMPEEYLKRHPGAVTYYNDEDLHRGRPEDK
jgi:hypothetical protein